MQIEMRAGPMPSQQKNALTTPLHQMLQGALPLSAGDSGSGSGRGDDGGGAILSPEDVAGVAPRETATILKNKTLGEGTRPSDNGSITVAPSRGYVTPEQPQKPFALQKEERLVVSSRSTSPEGVSQETSFGGGGGDGTGQGQGEAELISELDQAQSEIDSPSSVAKLYLALESLTHISSVTQAGKSLDGVACVAFCHEWPKDGDLPAFLDPSCLQAAWSVAEEQVGVLEEFTVFRGRGGG